MSNIAASVLVVGLVLVIWIGLIVGNYLDTKCSKEQFIIRHRDTFAPPRIHHPEPSIETLIHVVANTDLPPWLRNGAQDRIARRIGITKEEAVSRGGEILSESIFEVKSEEDAPQGPDANQLDGNGGVFPDNADPCH